MHWIKRSLRAFKAPVSSPARRPRLAFDALEDRTVPTASGVISGTVFFDSNANALADSSPIGLTGDFVMPGAAVSLTGTTNLGTPVTASTTTKSDGTFQFVKLEPGVYQVSSATSNFFTAVAGPGNLGGTATGNSVQTIVLTQGETESNLRFGLPGFTSNPVGISLRQFLNTTIGQTEQIFGALIPTAGTGRVVVDGATGTQTTGTASIDGDVVLASSQAGIAGVKVQLSGVDNFGAPYLFTTTTDSAGHYRFANLPAASFFINVIPGADHRAAGVIVGSLGGGSPRADQLVTTILTSGAVGTGYNFNLTPFAGDLDAGLANDVGNGSLGTSGDGITSDPSIRGRLVNPSNYTALEARFIAGATTEFVSVKSSLNADGSFVLNEQTMRDIFDGGFPDGDYTVEIRATAKDGSTISKSVSFTLNASGPTFLSAFPNLTSAASASNVSILLSGAFTDPNITNSIVTMKVLKGTTAMDINVELYDRETPRSVANFFSYFTRYGQNGGTIFHRLHEEAALEVLQGGGYTFNDASNTISEHITQDPTIRNEFSTDRPNSLGTLSAAKIGGDPNSFSSEFFFNLSEANANTLSVNNNGGFTVFGKVQSEDDLNVLKDLASVPIKNAGGQSELPLVDGATLDENNVERIQQIVTVFRDSELTYTATSSNPAVATVATDGLGSFQGNLLNIDFLAAGTTTISITATDSTNNFATTTFVITVT